ncbi:MAG: S-adenosyl-l-methionine hydroxide adenosyltransferase family protein [Halobacteriaceae archaeon]
MITLASDFGSPYPAAMKGVICRASDARIVDVSHEFPRQDVRTAAFWTREVLPWFPPAVHCVVVDPGVGTDRAALVVRAGEHALVGPDNGVLLPAARALAGDDGPEVFAVTVADPESATFHGRDVFAPTAARVHEAGVDAVATLDGVGPVDEFVDLRFPAPDTGADGTVRGEVLVVDGFGNVVTNVPGDAVRASMGDALAVDGEAVPVRRSYAAVDPGERLVTVGSHGHVEFAVNRGRGDEAFGLTVGDAVRLG